MVTRIAGMGYQAESDSYLEIFEDVNNARQHHVFYMRLPRFYPDVEVYLNDDPVNMKYEVWMPVVRK